MRLNELLHPETIFRILRNRFKLIIICTLLGIITSIGITNWVIAPQYQASAELIAQTKPTEEGRSNPQMNINDNILMINTYKDMILGALVLGEVQNKLVSQGYDLTVAQIKDTLRIEQSQDSQMFKITAMSGQPKESVAIVNTTAKVFQNKAQKVIDVNKVTITSPAVVPKDPVYPDRKSNYLIGMILGVMIGSLAAFLLETLNRTVKDSQFISKDLEIPLLGQVSEMNPK